MRVLSWIVALCAAGCFESAAQPGVCALDDRRDCTCDDGGPGWETCYGASPAVWGPCTCNVQPVADAGENRIVPYRRTVMLDGSRSVDEDGPGRSYRWTTESIPDGSAAVLDDPSNPWPSFFTDVPGDYRFSLTVDDGLKTSAAATVIVRAINNEPVAVATPGSSLLAGTAHVLDGSASTDENGDLLTYQWTVTSAPAGSVAQPASPSSASTTFVPDVHGSYVLTLVVNDGRVSSAPVTVKIEAFFPFTMLPTYVRDAEYSEALDRVVFVGFEPQLYIFDPVNRTTASVALSREPKTVALSPDGQVAVVGHQDLVSVVRLQNPAVLLTKALTMTTAHDIVHGGNGYAYVFPDLGGRLIQNVPLGSAAVTAGEDYTLEYHAKLVPGTSTIYAAARTFDAIIRFDIVNSIASQTRGVDSKSCGELWISTDAQRIFTRCGTVFSISNVEAQDMSLQDSLQGVTYVQHLSQSPAGKVLMTNLGPTLRVHAYPSFVLEKEIVLPRFLIDGIAKDPNGEFVFVRPNNTYTVIQSTSTSSATVSGAGTFPL